MHKLLIDNFYLPCSLRTAILYEQYEYFRKLYKAGNHYIVSNDIRVFGPFPEPEVPWDISEPQKIATYNPEVRNVLKWIYKNLVVDLTRVDYKTLHVLIRIATGMLNNCNIPKEVQIMFHDNMVENINSEYNEIILSQLPF